MGGSLGPFLANIIMVELEAKVIRPLIGDGSIKFYTRFVDDTLLLLRQEDIERVKTELERFYKNLKFIYDAFENETPHFLDIEITSNVREKHFLYRLQQLRTMVLTNLVDSFTGLPHKTIMQTRNPGYQEIHLLERLPKECLHSRQDNSPTTKTIQRK